MLDRLPFVTMTENSYIVFGLRPVTVWLKDVVSADLQKKKDTINSHSNFLHIIENKIKNTLLLELYLNTVKKKKMLFYHPVVSSAIVDMTYLVFRTGGVAGSPSYGVETDLCRLLVLLDRVICPADPHGIMR